MADEREGNYRLRLTMWKLHKEIFFCLMDKKKLCWVFKGQERQRFAVGINFGFAYFIFYGLITHKENL